jgi:hypothetical protein
MRMSALTIPVRDPIEIIRSRPEMYVPGGVPTGDVLTVRLVADVVCLTDRNITVRHVGEWWIVACEDDWLAANPKWSVQDYFKRVWLILVEPARLRSQ